MAAAECRMFEGENEGHAAAQVYASDDGGAAHQKSLGFEDTLI